MDRNAHENPLPHGHVRDHALDQLGGEGAHAPAPTRGAEAAALAREGDDHLVGAARAADVEAPVFEDAAAQVGAQLAGDEGGQPGALVPGGGGQEAIQMGLEGPVQDRVLGLAALIGRRRAGGDARVGCSGGAWGRPVASDVRSRPWRRGPGGRAGAPPRPLGACPGDWRAPGHGKGPRRARAGGMTGSAGGAPPLRVRVKGEPVLEAGTCRRGASPEGPQYRIEPPATG